MHDSKDSGSFSKRNEATGSLPTPVSSPLGLVPTPPELAANTPRLVAGTPELTADTPELTPGTPWIGAVTTDTPHPSQGSRTGCIRHYKRAIKFLPVRTVPFCGCLPSFTFPPPQLPIHHCSIIGGWIYLSKINC